MAARSASMILLHATHQVASAQGSAQGIKEENMFYSPSPTLIFPGSGGYRCAPNPQNFAIQSHPRALGAVSRGGLSATKGGTSRGRVCPWACVCMGNDFSESTSCALTLVPIPQHSLRLTGTAIDCGRMTSVHLVSSVYLTSTSWR
jgi:hypothetical protein